MGEKFWKSVPPQNGSSALWNDEAAVSTATSSVQLVSLNHMALGVENVQTMTKYAASLSTLVLMRCRDTSYMGTARRCIEVHEHLFMIAK